MTHSRHRGHTRLRAATALLAASDVFVTHAGFSSVREALSAGVPMVAVPLFADQPANARRIEELGAGVPVDAVGLTADGLAAAVERVLGEPAFRSAALEFRCAAADHRLRPAPRD
ncbi:nucleotide disphospho-sugar-binding domain-containing protein [Amycolatopsis sp. lyj-109]|uniref:nucleotide disphospho-sugar-binding domain-containing protein n=1 Tax=Amycolatopsis sp. lyj-109 TaxID=2789287 RepID=UPI0039781169